MPERLRLMSVHAHPDDESSKGAATLARYVAEGVEVMVVTCTGGERGDVLNPGMAHDPAVQRDIAEVRRREMAEAAQILGVSHRWLGFVDSGLPEGDPLPPLPGGCFAQTPLQIAAAGLVRLVREFRPQVMITYDENGGYPHPDHIMCHRVSVEAFEAAADADRYPGLGAPWQPSKLYYDRMFTPGRLRALHEAVLAEGLESPFQPWLERQDEAAERFAAMEASVTTRITCGDYFEQRDRALLAHRTQIDPTGFFFSIPLDLQRKVWPTEEFQLARTVGLDGDLAGSVSESGGGFEDDLFAGLRVPMEV